jgi:broad specificity phosphatase PhoE
MNERCLGLPGHGPLGQTAPVCSPVRAAAASVIRTLAWVTLSLIPAAVSASPPAAAGAAESRVSARSGPTTVILVRHAEKNTAWLGADPPLAPAGQRRARDLAHVLGDAGISAIVVTPWLRNRQTAEPLARRLGDSLIVVDPVDETVQRVLEHRGETVLVVGHGDTIPRLLAALLGEAKPDSTPVRYDDLYVVSLIPGQAARLTRLHYGAPSPFSP